LPAAFGSQPRKWSKLRFSIISTTMCFTCEVTARSISGLSAAPAARPPVVFKNVLRSMENEYTIFRPAQ
jgi:hypothetical protein